MLPNRALREDIIASLRNGTVPQRGLEHVAVGLDRFVEAIDQELGRVAQGKGAFKAVRGEYGSGKTFFSRWVQHRARAAGFASAEVQISETETPLHHLETVYRRALEHLETREWKTGAFRALIDRWFFSLEEEVTASGAVKAEDVSALEKAVGDLLEQRLKAISATQPLFAIVLRAVYRARLNDERSMEEGLISWLMGQPNVGAEVKRYAGVKGEIDHLTASGFLNGLLVVLKETGRAGLFLVLDEAETIQRMRSDAREKSLNALRQLVDDLDAGRYPGLYVLVTGTTSFFESPAGIRRLPPLEQRLHQDFSGDARFDNPKATQIRLLPFDHERLVSVGRRIRELYPAKNPERVAAKVDDAALDALARGVAGALGGKVGVAPRLYLRKLVSELCDKVDEFSDYDPAKHFKVLVEARELSLEERAVVGVDDVTLDLKANAKPGEID